MKKHLLLGYGLAMTAVITMLAWFPSVHAFPWPGLPIFGLAFAIYAMAARVARDQADEPTTLRTIWLVAIASRVALLPLAPGLTDDFYRYLWDGHVQLSGLNPYLFAPGAAEVEGLRTVWHSLINNPTVPTIYPPLAQIAFLLIAGVGSSVLLIKLLWVSCDLATAWVISRIAVDRGAEPALPLLLYAWAPLLIVEVAWNGHLEPLGLLMLAMAIWAGDRAAASRDAHRQQFAAVAAGAALALSALTKFAPAAALPGLVRRLGWRAFMGFALVIAALYAPYLSAGSALFAGLRTYSENWWFMKGPFTALEVLTGDPDEARRAAAVIMIGVIGWAAWRRFDLERTLLWVLGAGMVLTPTLHPWYILWMLPMAALRANRPFVLLSGLAFIGYYGLGAYRDTGDWVQPIGARMALWTPFLILLLFDAWRAYRVEAPGDVRLEPR
jgi:hypothetical protein